MGYFKSKEEAWKYARFFDFQVGNYVNFLKENDYIRTTEDKDYTSELSRKEETPKDQELIDIKLFQKKRKKNDKNLDLMEFIENENKSHDKRSNKEEDRLE